MLVSITTAWVHAPKRLLFSTSAQDPCDTDSSEKSHNNKWMNERIPKLVPVPPSWKYLETNGAARTWQGPEYKVLCQSHKEKKEKKNGDDNELESLKIMQSAIERYLNDKNYPRSNAHSREFHNSRDIHRRITEDAPLNSFSKNNERSRPQPQKKGRPSIIDSGDENWTFMHEVHCFRSDFRTTCSFVTLEWVFITWHCFAY